MASEFRIRILEIDNAHAGGREDVRPTIEPIVDRACRQAHDSGSGIQIRAGDLKDADLNHTSYFIGVRYPIHASNESQVNLLFRECRDALKSFRPAVPMEITETHPAYARLVNDFGW